MKERKNQFLIVLYKERNQLIINRIQLLILNESKVKAKIFKGGRFHDFLGEKSD